MRDVWYTVGCDRLPVVGSATVPKDVVNLRASTSTIEGAAVSEPLAPGTAAPEFTLPDAAGRPVSLAEFRGKPVVVVFYPLDWNPRCGRQLDLYQQELDELGDGVTRLIGISVDSVYSHRAWAAVRGLEIPLLSDFHPKGDVAKRYNVWRQQDGFSERALYVIDAGGLIVYSHVSPYLHEIPDTGELVDAVELARKLVE
jgi:peroxiredoxin